MFSLLLFGRRHHLISMPSLAKQLYSQRSTTVSSDELFYHVLERVFGDNGTTRMVPREEYMSELHGQSEILLREPELGSMTDRMTRAYEERVPSLVTRPPREKGYTIWERCARVSLVDETSINADLYSLINYSMGDIAARILMGRVFVDSYPSLLEDMNILDNAFGSLLAGIPAITPGVRRAKSARLRLKAALRPWVEAVVRYEQSGGDFSASDGDLSDVSVTIRSWTANFHEIGAHLDAIVASSLGFLSGILVNSNKIAFWMLLHVLEDVDLLRRRPTSLCREERSRWTAGFGPIRGASIQLAFSFKIKQGTFALTYAIWLHSEEGSRCAKAGSLLSGRSWFWSQRSSRFGIWSRQQRTWRRTGRIGSFRVYPAS